MKYLSHFMMAVLSVGVTLAIVRTKSCNFIVPPGNTITPSSGHGNTCYICPDNKTNETTYQPLQAGYVKDLISNYRNNQWTWTSNALTGGTRTRVYDSRSVWFSLDKMKAFIANIEAQVDGHSECPGNHCDRNLGVRIYFGAYGGNAPAPYPLYDSLHTLVMIPTYYNPAATDPLNKNVDFDPSYMSACGDPTLSFPEKDTALLLALMPTIQTSMMNHGTIIPPPDPFTQCTGARFMQLVDRLDRVPGTVACP